jgi:hypothetical protein
MPDRLDGRFRLSRQLVSAEDARDDAPAANAAKTMKAVLRRDRLAG